MHKEVILLILCSLNILTVRSVRLTFLGGDSPIQSMALYNGISARERATINFQFKTANPQGLILYIGGERAKTFTYLKLSLINGRLVLAISYSLEKNKAKELGTDLNDLLWHNVTIIRNHRETLFELDGTQTLMSKLHWEKELDVSSKMYIGHTIDDAKDDGFVGCIKDLKFAEGYEKLTTHSPSVMGSRVRYGCYNHCNKKVSKPFCGKGKCINRFTTYSCECFGSGYEGKSCDKASPVISLSSNMDFISKEVLPLNAIKSNKIQIRFKTLNRDGILLTLGKRNDYLTLELYLGRIRLEINVGGGKLVMRNSRELDDGLWHDVQVLQNIASFTLIVDDKKLTRYEETQKSPYAIPDSRCGGNDIAYFGGHFNPITVIGSESKQGFVGCLQQFHFNTINLVADVIYMIISNVTSHPDIQIDGKIKNKCDLIAQPTKEREIPPDTKPPIAKRTTKKADIVVATKENLVPSASNMKQSPKLDQRTGKKLKKTSVAWITAGIVIGALVLILAIGLLIHRFRKKYRGSFMAPSDENGMQYYSSVYSGYQSHSNSRKHMRGNVTDV